MDIMIIIVITIDLFLSLERVCLWFVSKERCAYGGHGSISKQLGLLFLELRHMPKETKRIAKQTRPQEVEDQQFAQKKLKKSKKAKSILTTFCCRWDDDDNNLKSAGLLHCEWIQ